MVYELDNYYNHYPRYENCSANLQMYSKNYGESQPMKITEELQ